MKKLNFLALTAILTVCALMRQPSPASAAPRCPTDTCNTWINLCDETCPGPYTVRQVGTCTDAAGETQNLDVVQCRCVTRSCWSLQ
jgi:hypothetical protein